MPAALNGSTLPECERATAFLGHGCRNPRLGGDARPQPGECPATHAIPTRAAGRAALFRSAVTTSWTAPGSGIRNPAGKSRRPEKEPDAANRIAYRDRGHG
jgi:hypothetical protein